MTKEEREEFLEGPLTFSICRRLSDETPLVDEVDVLGLVEDFPTKIEWEVEGKFQTTRMFGVRWSMSKWEDVIRSLEDGIGDAVNSAALRWTTIDREVTKPLAEARVFLCGEEEPDSNDPEEVNPFLRPRQTP